ncbi:activating signal cointegrator 1 complex subunit, partial [Coemansia sp. RSA 2424]
MNQTFKVIEVGTRRYWVRTALSGSADDMILKSKSSNMPVVRHEMAIAQQLHKFIIGTQGATINSIQSETNTRIIVPKNPRDPIKVVGTAADVSAATQRIQQIVDANIQSVPYTHFISLPISDTDVQRRVGAFQSQIGQERLRNVDCSSMCDTAKLHITIGMLRLTSPAEIAGAVDLLKSLQPEVYGVLKDRPLVIEIGGVAAMEADLARARVIYAGARDFST